jgi:hypothetical protein
MPSSLSLRRPAGCGSTPPRTFPAVDAVLVVIVIVVAALLARAGMTAVSVTLVLSGACRSAARLVQALRTPPVATAGSR